jgi:hypothetical protein
VISGSDHSAFQQESPAEAGLFQGRSNFDQYWQIVTIRVRQ